MAIPVMAKSVRLATPYCSHHRATEMRLAHQEHKCCLSWYGAGGYASPSVYGHEKSYATQALKIDLPRTEAI